MAGISFNTWFCWAIEVLLAALALSGLMIREPQEDWNIHGQSDPLRGLTQDPHGP